MLRDNLGATCISPSIDNEYQKRWNRDMYEDFKVAIDLVKELKMKLDKLHPDVLSKIMQLL